MSVLESQFNCYSTLKVVAANSLKSMGEHSRFAFLTGKEAPAHFPVGASQRLLSLIEAGHVLYRYNPSGGDRAPCRPGHGRDLPEWLATSALKQNPRTQGTYSGRRSRQRLCYQTPGASSFSLPTHRSPSLLWLTKPRPPHPCPPTAPLLTDIPGFRRA